MKIAALEGSPGAVVTDLPADLRDLAPGESEMIRAAFAEYALLVFRGREIEVEEQLALGAELGTLIDQAGEGNWWFNITNLGGGYDGQLCFHADFTNTPGLLTGAILYGAVLPRNPTATEFAHTGAALEALPAELRARIADLRAVHASVLPGTIVDQPLRHQIERAHGDRAEHPLVLEHPETGKPMLFVNDMQIERVVGMSVEESTALLDELSGWIQRPEFRYRHQWQLHDVVVWDQVVMQHSRAAETTDGERTLRRVSFTHPSYAQECQANFTSLGGSAGRSGSQVKVM